MSTGRLPSTDLSVRSIPVGRSALHGSLRAHPYRRGSPLPSGLAGAASMPPFHTTVPQAASSLNGLSAIPAHTADDAGISNTTVTPHRVSASATTPPNLSPWSSHSSLQDGDNIDTRFTPYTPPHMQQPAADSTSLSPAGLGIEDIEFMIRSMSLEAERTAVIQYNQMARDEKLTVLFLHVLRLSSDLKEVTMHVVETDRRQDSIQQLVQQAWQPSKAQTTLIRSLVRHFLVKPISSYSALPDYVKTYVADHARDLRLGLYLRDKTVKTTLNMLISDVSTQMKSAFRKAVFASCVKKIPLHSFARNMLDNYHLPAIPADIPLAILGTLALMREIAEPLSKKPNSTKGDTGFWRAVQEELSSLYDDFGSNDRQNDVRWVQWASDKVKEDARRFPAAGGRFSAATREELDRVLGSTANQENVDADILGDDDGAVPPENGQEIDEEHMDGDVEVSAMGDVAATVHMDTA